MLLGSYPIQIAGGLWDAVGLLDWLLLLFQRPVIRVLGGRNGFINPFPVVNFGMAQSVAVFTVDG